MGGSDLISCNKRNGWRMKSAKNNKVDGLFYCKVIDRLFMPFALF